MRMFGLKKRLIVLVSLLGWTGIVGTLLSSAVMVATLRAKSMGAAMLIAALCAVAMWSFHAAYRKSRAAGNSSFADLYEDLALRFCLTPLAVMALIFFIGIKMAP
jgi:hypothetical protein